MQSLPQPLQLRSSFVMFTSQPSRATSSTLQFAKSASQPMLHAPPKHVGVPFTPLHAPPQLPQLLSSVSVAVSQPSRLTFSSALQSLKPALQAMLHSPPAHAGAPLVVLQAPPQLPQLVVSVFVFTSQPLPWLASQSANPATQLYWHAPSEHPPEVMFGGAPAAQSFPHAPQFASSVASSASQPLPGSASQLSKPASQVWSHAPLVHAGAALVQSSGHTVTQSPQALMSASVLVSQPSRLAFSSALQSLKPAEQPLMLQLPLAQFGVPLLVPHAALQPPQWSSSVFRFVSHPASPVQSPKPALHA